jgi:hypothetical protein
MLVRNVVFDVIPAKAGIQLFLLLLLNSSKSKGWMTNPSAVESPALAGMTSKRGLVRC